METKSVIRQRISDLVNQIESEDLLQRIYKFVKYIRIAK